MTVIKKYKFTLLTTIVILFFLLMPTSGVSDDTTSFFDMIPYFDKIVHCCMFGFLALVYGFERKITKERVVLNIITLVCFALLTEILQKLTGYRTFDYFDLLADTMGIIVGTIIMPFILKKYNSKM